MSQVLRTFVLMASTVFLAIWMSAFCGDVLADYPDGTLVRERPGSVVYEIRNGRKFPVVDTKRIATRTVIDMPSAEVALIPDMPLNTMYGNSPAVPPVQMYGHSPFVLQPAPGGVFMQPRPLTAPMAPMLPAAPMQAGVPSMPANAPNTLPPPPPVGDR